jgi:hypothetical protein
VSWQSATDSAQVSAALSRALKCGLKRQPARVSSRRSFATATQRPAVQVEAKCTAINLRNPQVNQLYQIAPERAFRQLLLDGTQMLQGRGGQLDIGLTQIGHDRAPQIDRIIILQ